jgi:zinc transporter 9
MSAPSASYKAVVTALAANVFVTLAKFVAFFLSGSGAMLSEAIHSAADAGNQLLLFIGLRRGARERDDAHPYGYDAERFVFGILSAAGIFFIGAGVTVVHGIEGLFHPQMPHFGPTTFGVLIVSFLLEGLSMFVAVRALLKERGERPVLRYLLKEADPAGVAIVLEDSAAVLGLVLASVGIVLCQLTQNPVWDALGSIVVGLILGGIAVHLARENRELLLGVAVPKEVAARFTALVGETKGIRRVHDVKTRQLAPDAYTFKAEITLDEAVLVEKILAGLPPDDPLLGQGRERMVSELTVRVVNSISDLIDEIEEKVRAEIPRARHIDLEVDHTDFKRSSARSLPTEKEETAGARTGTA